MVESSTESPAESATAPRAATRPAPSAGLGRGAVLLMAVIAALAAASLYYIQPLLSTIATQFSVSTGRASLLVTATQIGFVIGLVCFGSLGDTVNRHRLITALLLASGAVLLTTAAMPSFWLLCAAMLAVGATASCAQVTVPFAAALAAPEQRGRITGSVMGGLLLGILLARTVSGLLADAAGWRTVFVVAAAAMLVLAGAAHRALPADREAKESHSFLSLLASVLAVVRAEPVLRHRMRLSFVSMLNFSAMWTSIAFLLARGYHFGEAVIGVFSLVGAVGAACAPLVGRLADRGHGRALTTVGWGLFAAGWLFLWLGQSVLAGLVVGLLVFDAAAQTIQVSNQSRIYQLAAQARGRITTAYMVSMFSGGILGSLLSGLIFGAWGWAGVCVAGLIATVVGFGLWVWHSER